MKELLEHLIVDYYYYYLLILTLLILFFLIKNYRLIKRPFIKIKKKTWVCLLLIFLVGLTIRVGFIPHIHQVNYDEQAFLNTAESVAKERQLCDCRSKVDNEGYAWTVALNTGGLLTHLPCQ